MHIDPSTYKKDERHSLIPILNQSVQKIQRLLSDLSVQKKYVEETKKQLDAKVKYHAQLKRRNGTDRRRAFAMKIANKEHKLRQMQKKIRVFASQVVPEGEINNKNKQLQYLKNSETLQKEELRILQTLSQDQDTSKEAQESIQRRLNVELTILEKEIQQKTESITDLEKALQEGIASQRKNLEHHMHEANKARDYFLSLHDVPSASKNTSLMIQVNQQLRGVVYAGKKVDGSTASKKNALQRFEEIKTQLEQLMSSCSNPVEQHVIKKQLFLVIQKLEEALHADKDMSSKLCAEIVHHATEVQKHLQHDATRTWKNDMDGLQWLEEVEHQFECIREVNSFGEEILSTDSTDNETSSSGSSDQDASFNKAKVPSAEDVRTLKKQLQMLEKHQRSVSQSRPERRAELQQQIVVLEGKLLVVEHTRQTARNRVESLRKDVTEALNIHVNDGELKSVSTLEKRILTEAVLLECGLIRQVHPNHNALNIQKVVEWIDAKSKHDNIHKSKQVILLKRSVFLRMNQRLWHKSHKEQKRTQRVLLFWACQNP